MSREEVWAEDNVVSATIAKLENRVARAKSLVALGQFTAPFMVSDFKAALAAAEAELAAARERRISKIVQPTRRN